MSTRRPSAAPEVEVEVEDVVEEEEDMLPVEATEVCLTRSHSDVVNRLTTSRRRRI